MARRYRTYTDRELLAALAQVNQDLGVAGEGYGGCQRHHRPYWRNRLRSLGQRKRSVCGELARRGLLHDPKERWSHAR